MANTPIQSKYGSESRLDHMEDYTGAQARDPAAESPYYGPSDARRRGVGPRATDAAFDSIRYARNHAFDSITEGVSDVGKRTKRAAHGFTDFVGTHAIPLALLGAGIGWLLTDMSNKRRASAEGRADVSLDARPPGAMRQRSVEMATRAADALHEGRDLLVDRAHEVVDRAQEVGAQLTSRVKDLSDQAKLAASNLADHAASYGRQAYGAVGRAGTRTLKLTGDNPFVTGLVVLVLGATAGLLLPATRREKRLMGESRDRLLHATQQAATQLKESAQHGVEELKNAIASPAQPST